MDDQVATTIVWRQNYLYYDTSGKRPYFLQQKFLLAAIIISPHYLCGSFSVTFNLLGMHSFPMWETIAWASKSFRTIWTLIRSCTSVLIDVKLQQKQKLMSWLIQKGVIKLQWVLAHIWVTRNKKAHYLAGKWNTNHRNVNLQKVLHSAKLILNKSV